MDSRGTRPWDAGPWRTRSTIFAFVALVDDNSFIQDAASERQVGK